MIKPWNSYCSCRGQLLRVLRSRVQGLGFKVQGLGFRNWGLGFQGYGSGFRVSGIGLTIAPEALKPEAQFVAGISRCRRRHVQVPEQVPGVGSCPGQGLMTY